MKRNKLFFSVALLMVLMVTSLFATDYLVSGAGSSEVNGTYVENGTNNDKPYYQKDSYYLLWSTEWPEGWTIKNDMWGDGIEYIDMHFPIYSNSTVSDTPPATGWECMDGNPPAPTVSQAGPSISYSVSSFQESDENDGSIDVDFTITHDGVENNTFTGNNGDEYVAAGKVVITNLPAGFAVTITQTSSLILAGNISGIASSHDNANDVANLTFTFQNSAFSGGDASAVGNSVKDDLVINFVQVLTVAASGGDYSTIASALSACDDGDVFNLANETFTEYNLTVDKNITIRGEGSDVTIVQAHESADTADGRVFLINDSKIVTIEAITVRHGYVASTGGGILNEEY